MQNVGQSENRNIDKVNVQLDVVKSSTPQSSASSPAKSETETYSGAPAKYMTDSSESEDDSVSEAEMEEEGSATESSKFLLSHDDPERAVDPEMQARLETLLEVAVRLECDVRRATSLLSSNYERGQTVQVGGPSYEKKEKNKNKTLTAK
ncbi:jg14240 [Pararge aegeria aegeria]|uniref:Jg14240 protein n=1 Tax=Pararge aegeria aegeria TaxID=348720 RepID=A0A8S4RU94_9NEOP|nr:jg14240 [Pararge aegeria aegeria]